jgi:hypothetical protein
MSPAFSRAVVGVIAFVAVVGGITWVVQGLPKRGGNAEPVTVAPPPGNPTREIVHYSRKDPVRGATLAVWEREERNDPKTGGMTQAFSNYVLEYERNKEGACYFAFRNVSGAPAEMGVERADCDCSHAEICLLPKAQWDAVDAQLTETPWAIPVLDPAPEWREFSKGDHDGFKVPADGQGLLKIGWKGRKSPGEPLKIHLLFYSQPEGSNRDRQIDHIFVPVVMAAPLQFEPLKQSVGYIGPGESRTAEFYCWSPTRDARELEVSFQPEKADPLMQVQAWKMSPAECQTLQEKMRVEGKKETEAPTLRQRVKAGYRVEVTLHEKSGNQQMDLGHFSRAIPVFLDALPVDFSTPVITGVVKGDVDVGGVEDQGKVQLKTFSAAERATVTVPVYADRKAVLTLANHYPAILKVGLRRNEKASTPQRARWDLTVTVPALGWLGGALPEQSAVTLRIAGTPRQIRIPVTGTATR